MVLAFVALPAMSGTAEATSHCPTEFGYLSSPPPGEIFESGYTANFVFRSVGYGYGEAANTARLTWLETGETVEAPSQACQLTDDGYSVHTATVATSHKVVFNPNLGGGVRGGRPYSCETLFNEPSTSIFSTNRWLVCVWGPRPSPPPPPPPPAQSPANPGPATGLPPPSGGEPPGGDPPPDCGEAAGLAGGSKPVRGPAIGSAPHTRWHMNATISADDGLVLQNVRLGERLMARRISLPYYRYALRPAGPVRTAELKPRGNQATARSRLKSFRVLPSEPAAAVVKAVVVEAVWIVDRLPRAGEGACLEIVQSYEFRAPKRGDHCEPSGTVPCARFTPLVGYALSAPEGGGDRVASMSLPQRLHFAVDEVDEETRGRPPPVPFNAAALMEDHDGPSFPTQLDLDIRSLPTIRAQINPLLHERRAMVVSGGRALAAGSRWDNYHQTPRQAVLPPRVALPPLWVAPGCPECVHIHWRWSAASDDPDKFPGFEDHNGGRIRVDSPQDVVIGIAKYHKAAAELDPVTGGWESLVNPRELLGSREGARFSTPRKRGQRGQLVLWYDGRSQAESDSFFTHGGFFSPEESGPPVISRARVSPPRFRAGSMVKLLYRLSEWAAVEAVVYKRVTDREFAWVGRLTFDGGKGPNEEPLPTTLSGRPLTRGDYFIRLVATDVAGKPSVLPRVPFTVSR